jgi:tRNA(fMet)-specific endonuclease VapC
MLDTNVLVALIRAGALGQYIDETYQPRASKFRPIISVVSVGELLSLSRQFDWGEKKTAPIYKLVGNLVVVDIDTPEILAAYGEIDHTSRAGGRKMGKNDVWIAATAKVTGATLLTTDRDFDHLSVGSPIHTPGMPAIGVRWIDPRSGERKD